MSKVQEWTVFVQDIDGGGTIHIQSYRSRTSEYAAKLAIRTVANDWSQKPNTLHVLGIAKGNVEIVEWNDLGT